MSYKGRLEDKAIGGDENTEPSPLALSTKSLREAVSELEGLLNSRFASVYDIREGLERLEGAEVKLRPRYIVSVKRLSPLENQDVADLLERSWATSFLATRRIGLAVK